MTDSVDKCRICKFAVGYSAHICQCWSSLRSIDAYGNDTIVTVVDPAEETLCKYHKER